MAGDAGDLVPGVSAADAPNVRRLVQMALQADLRALRWRHFGGIANQGRIGGFGMLAGRPMAGFASFALPSALGARLNDLVRIPAERLGDVLVTRLAGLRSHIRSRSRLRRRLL